MYDNIIIQYSAVKYILIQRTELKKKYRLLDKIWRNLRIPYHHLSSVEALLRRNSIKQGFNELIAAEYEIIKSYLPRNIKNVLDIGCGIAGIDIAMFQHYNMDLNIKFFLLDKSELNDNSNIRYEFANQATFYNSLSESQIMMANNGIRDENIYLLNATDDYEININNEKIDLVISLKAWGFHFPVDTYLNRVHKIMNIGGTLIIDVRKNTEGERALKQKFDIIELIMEMEKHNRWVLTKTR